MRLSGRALLFVAAACVPLLPADAIWGIGFVPLDLQHRLGGMHWLFHLGTVTLSTLGAVIAFSTIGEPAPSMARIVASGLLFGGLSIAAAPAALIVGDAQGVAFWQFIGAMFAAALSGSFAKPTQAGGARR